MASDDPVGHSAFLALRERVQNTRKRIEDCVEELEDVLCGDAGDAALEQVILDLKGINDFILGD
jgi:hypothetical protein